MHKKKKAKAVSTQKAPNKRKQMRAMAAEPAATPPIPMTIAEKPTPRLPLIFWPLEVLRWWTPSVTRSWTELTPRERLVPAHIAWIAAT